MKNEGEEEQKVGKCPSGFTGTLRSANKDLNSCLWPQLSLGNKIFSSRDKNIQNQREMQMFI